MSVELDGKSAHIVSDGEVISARDSNIESLITGSNNVDSIVYKGKTFLAPYKSIVTLDGYDWNGKLKEEYDAIIEYKDILTYDLTHLPNGQKFLDSRLMVELHAVYNEKRANYDTEDRFFVTTDIAHTVVPIDATNYPAIRYSSIIKLLDVIDHVNFIIGIEDKNKIFDNTEPVAAFYIVLKNSDGTPLTTLAGSDDITALPKKMTIFSDKSITDESIILHNEFQHSLQEKRIAEIRKQVDPYLRVATPLPDILYGILGLIDYVAEVAL